MPPPELIKKKHYRQKDKAACIPASIRMAISHFDETLADAISEADLMQLLGTSSTGSLYCTRAQLVIFLCPSCWEGVAPLTDDGGTTPFQQKVQFMPLLSILEHLSLSQLGFEATSEQSSLVGLALHLHTLQTPVIAVLYAGYVEYLQSDTLHAVVIVGIDEGKVYLNDPLREASPVVFSIDQFNRAWNFWDNTLIKVQKID